MKNTMKNLTMVSLAATIAFTGCKKEESTTVTPNLNQQNMPCLPSMLGNSVMAFYPFSNGSTNDFSGNGHHLQSPFGAVSATADRGGNPHCALQFCNGFYGPFQALKCSNTTFLNGLTQFSISLWYKPVDSTRNGEIWEILVSRGDSASCPDRYGDWSVSLYDCRRAVFGRQNSVWDNMITSHDCEEEINVRTGAWHHLAATFDQANNAMRIYRDGVLQQSAGCIGNCGSGLVPAISDTGDLILGLDYNGLLDDVILFNRALSQSEINQLYSMEACCSN